MSKVMNKKAYTYKAYIAANEHTKSFDHCYGTTRKSAEAAIKREWPRSWRDCCVWSVALLPGGESRDIG